MPLMGPIPEGRTFFCPHCGALYSVTYSRLSKSDSDIAKCVVCLQIMTSWVSTKIPTTSSCSDPKMPNRLRKRPRDPAQLAKNRGKTPPPAGRAVRADP